MNDILLVVHGIPSEGKAKDIVTILQDYKDFKIKESVIIASTENYKVIQIHKNLGAFIDRKPEVTPEVKPSNPQEKKPEVQKDVKAELNKVEKTDSKIEKLNPTEISNELVIPTKKP